MRNYKNSKFRDTFRVFLNSALFDTSWV